ncbi:MAG: right-handed parallel beta-helix repeat-containing protein, partial [Candidatus Heimdallarchaeaceae archaeon]
AIEFYASGNTIVTNNTCNNSSYGLYIDLSANSTVINNTCNNGGYGIYLSNSGSSTIDDNTFSNNDEVAIDFYASGNSTVTNNTCSNSNIGINIDNSDFCNITYNLLQENEGYGICLRANSDNNLIHHNTFVDNNLGGTSQAYDDGIRNTWFDDVSLEGNTWSDLSGAVFYLIDGSAISVDLYPLEEPIIVEYPQIVPLALLLSIVILFLTRTISRKLKK